MPDCQLCIPGLEQGQSKNDPCVIHSNTESLPLRQQLPDAQSLLLTEHQTPQMLHRLEDVGKLIGKDRPQTILEIGPTNNPLWNFFPADFCPAMVVLVQEPQGDGAMNKANNSSSSSPLAWQSIIRPCTMSTPNKKYPKDKPKSTHLLTVPMNMQQYLESQHFRDARFDAVVCMGACSSSSSSSSRSNTSYHTTKGVHTNELAMIPRPFHLYLEYLPGNLAAANQFNETAVADRICGQNTASTPTFTQEYKFDDTTTPNQQLPKHQSFPNHTPLRTIVQSYHCIHFVTHLSDPHTNLVCDPTEQSYQGMACMSEMHSILRVREPAYFPVEPSMDTFRIPRHHNCSLCLEMSEVYNMSAMKWRAPFPLFTRPAEKTSLSPMSFSQQQVYFSKETLPGYDILDGNGFWNVALLIFFVFFGVWRFRGIVFSSNGIKRRYSALRQSLRSSTRIKDSRTTFSRKLAILIVFGGVLVALFTVILQQRFKDAKNAQTIKKLLLQPSTDTRLRLHDGKFFVDYAQKMSHEGKHWDAFAASTVARAILHSGSPTDVTIQKGGLLYQAIVDYNHYFSRIIDLEPQEYPTTYKHTLSQCPKYLDTSYKDIVYNQLEPILPDTRNHGFHELDMKIDLFSYQVLPAISSVSKRKYRKKILLDVGTNGFFASAKALIDMYVPFQKFDEIHLFEPDLNGMKIPKYYEASYNITFHQIYVKTGTRDSSDIVKLLEEIATPEDFVALKYDVDHGRRGNTMEWGFLADLMDSKALRLVDEFFIELHFCYKDLGWKHRAHSMEQAYDILRQLRQCGLAIHAWP